MAITATELRRRGYSADDIALARTIQDANRRAGAPARSMAEILAGQSARPRPSAVVDLTARQLRRRGGYGQAALLADQAALAEPDPEKAERARFHAAGLAALGKPPHFQFDLFGGNVTIGHQYVETIRSRLMEADCTVGERSCALATLLLITMNLGWQSHSCEKNAGELADLQGVEKAQMARTLALLESVGAITRAKRGRTKVITVTPEGAYRGRIDNHTETMNRYRAEVITLHPKPAA